MTVTSPDLAHVLARGLSCPCTQFHSRGAEKRPKQAALGSERVIAQLSGCRCVQGRAQNTLFPKTLSRLPEPPAWAWVPSFALCSVFLGTQQAAARAPSTKQPRSRSRDPEPPFLSRRKARWTPGFCSQRNSDLAAGCVWGECLFRGEDLLKVEALEPNKCISRNNVGDWVFRLKAEL